MGHGASKGRQPSARGSAENSAGQNLTEFVTFLDTEQRKSVMENTPTGRGREAHEMAAKKKKSHVFGSFRHSTNLGTPRHGRSVSCTLTLASWLADGGNLHSPNGNVLVYFEVLVLDACLVDFDALDRNDTFFWSKEPRRSRRVREKEPNEEGKDVPIRTEKRRTRRRWRRLM